MDKIGNQKVRLFVSFDGRWDQLANGDDRYIGGMCKGVFIDKGISFLDFRRKIAGVCQSGEKQILIQGLVVTEIGTWRILISDENDLQFFLDDDRGVHRVGVTSVTPPVCSEPSSSHICTPVRAPDNVAPSVRLGKRHEVDGRQVQLNDGEDGKTAVRATSKPPSEKRARVDELELELPSVPCNENARNTSEDDVGPEDDLADLHSNSDTLYEGQLFPCKSDLKAAAQLYAMDENFEFRLKVSNKSVIQLVCKDIECPWKLHAVRTKDGNYFQVRRFIPEHTCRGLDSKLGRYSC